MLYYVMNRVHDGEKIFYGNKNKSHFLDLLVDASRKLKLRIFDLVDAEFVNELFGTKKQLMTAIQTWGVRELPIIEIEYGEILGGKDFLESAIKKMI